MEVKIASVTTMWRDGKGILGELGLIDDILVFSKRGFFATYFPRGLVGVLDDVIRTQPGIFIAKAEEIESAQQGKFRLNKKALIVKMKNGEEIIFAISDKHKKWFALMDECINKNNIGGNFSS